MNAADRDIKASFATIEIKEPDVLFLIIFNLNSCCTLVNHLIVDELNLPLFTYMVYSIFFVVIRAGRECAHCSEEDQGK